MNEKTDLVVRAEESRELSISRAPHAVLEEARKAAAALNDVISQKKKKVMFNGEQYIEAEDWQTIGKFYNVSAKIEWTKYLEIGNVRGFEARAEVVHIPTGMVISGAEAMCMSDERNWSAKPLNQLRSMAQTRATSKALSMVLKWVVVMAGYKATPAEEIEHEEAPRTYTRPPVAATKAKTSYPVNDAIEVEAEPLAPKEETVTFAEAGLISGITTMLGAMNGGDEENMNAQLKTLTKWTPKGSTEEKFLQIKDLEGIAKHKPEWLKGVHKKVSEEYKKALSAQPQ